MKANCTCTLCKLALRLDIEQVFIGSREWLGVFQVRSRIQFGWCSWKFFMDVWIQMMLDGLLIESFAPDSDEFPRYLLSRLIAPPASASGR
jgi:hypothetical protein